MKAVLEVRIDIGFPSQMLEHQSCRMCFLLEATIFMLLHLAAYTNEYHYTRDG